MICEYCKSEMALIGVKNEEGASINKYQCFNCGHEEDAEETETKETT